MPIAWIVGGLGLWVFLMSKSEASEETNLIPNKYDSLFQKYASQYGLDWKFLKTIAENESSNGKDPRVARGILIPGDIRGSMSSDGKSWGLMQVTLTTGRDFDKNISEVKLNEPEYSIRIASMFISSLSKQFRGNFRDMAMAYNQGAGNQKRFIELEKSGLLKNSDFPAGREYWNRFQRNYKRLFGGNIA